MSDIWYKRRNIYVGENIIVIFSPQIIRQLQGKSCHRNTLKLIKSLFSFLNLILCQKNNLFWKWNLNLDKRCIKTFKRTRNTRFAGIPRCWCTTALDQSGRCQNVLKYSNQDLKLNICGFNSLSTKVVGLNVQICCLCFGLY